MAEQVDLPNYAIRSADDVINLAMMFIFTFAIHLNEYLVDAKKEGRGISGLGDIGWATIAGYAAVSTLYAWALSSRLIWAGKKIKARFWPAPGDSSREVEQ